MTHTVYRNKNLSVSLQIPLSQSLMYWSTGQVDKRLSYSKHVPESYFLAAAQSSIHFTVLDLIND